MIETSGLRMVFQEGTPLRQTAVDGVDLTIGADEFVTVVGSNGSGKSTLLNLIGGDMQPTAGSIALCGKDMTGLPSYRRASILGRVFQDPLGGTCASLTVEENLALAVRRAQPRRWSLAVTDDRRIGFRQSLARLNMGLEKRLTDIVGLLSGGQRQALSLVMATLTGSRILLLDEHTAALDPHMSSTVLEMTAKLAAEQRLCALMVTHSMQEALAVGTRTLIMHRGRIALDIAGAERAAMEPADLLEAFRSRHPAAAFDTTLAADAPI